MYQTPSTNSNQKVLLDGYGRAGRTELLNDSGSWYQQDACYDGNGNVYFRSYPYTGSGWTATKVCSGAGETYSYDVLGRLTQVMHGDGTNTKIQYTPYGRATKKVDENGVTRISQVDGLGRIRTVCEVTSATMAGNQAPSACGTDISATGFVTTYAYGYNGGPQTVISQGPQSRTFVTDWTGRPTVTIEPERGPSTYSYSANATGPTVVRTRAAANQNNSSVTTATTTQYDLWNRPLSITYTGNTTMPARAYAYDVAPSATYGQPQFPKGHLTSAASGSDATYFNYEAKGRVENTTQCFGSSCQLSVPQSYGYDLSDNLTLQTFLAPGVNWQGVTYQYSVANEVRSITNSGPYYAGASNNNGVVVSNVTQSALGPTLWTFGNGLNNVNLYNPDQLVGIWLCSNSTVIGCSGGTNPYAVYQQISGNRVTSLQDTVIGQRHSTTSQFAYDDMNRLTGVSYPDIGVAYNMSYDRYGNRWSQTYTQGSGTQQTFNFNPNNNQNTSFAYDSAGNQATDGMYQYSYDAEGNVTAYGSGSAAATYTYDALNHRTRDVEGSTSTFNVYDLNGHRVLTYDGNSGNLTKINVYWGNRFIAAYTGGQVYFQHSDVLGTVRAVTNSAGSTVGTFSSLPFGDGYTPSGTNVDPLHFSELDHDTSQTEHAQFRQYSPAQGRWMSPDPYSGSYHWRNPQSFNRYAYALNNPLSRKDPLGREALCTTESDYAVGDCGDGGGAGGGDGCSEADGCYTVSTTQDPDPQPEPTDPGACAVGCGVNEPVQDPGTDPPQTSTQNTPAPSNGVPQNPCAQAGNAQDPSYYINRARSSQINPIQLAQDLASFRRGQPLDAQPFGASPAYGNYVYGVYLRTAGLPLSVALAGANWYAGGGAGDGKAQYSGPLDPNYPNIPPANVANITNGYNAVRNGTVCHVQ